MSEELEETESKILSIAGLSKYTMGPHLDEDGIPIPDGTTSGEAINNLIQAARARRTEGGSGMIGHRWSGWPGAWCLDCGIECAAEIELAGPGAVHRYSDVPHLVKDCQGCTNGYCPEPGSRRCDPYALKEDEDGCW